MAEKTVYRPEHIDAEKTKIKRRDIFNFDELYKFMKRWHDDNGYDFKETEYMEKTSSYGTELHINWVGTKKISSYITFVIQTNFLILGMNKIEIQRGDQKIKLDKGEVEMKLDAHIVLDPEGKYEKSGFTRFFKPFYKKVIIKTRLDEYDDWIREDLYEFVDLIKKYLGITRVGYYP